MSMYDEMRYGDGVSFARLPGQSLSIAGRGRTIGRGEIGYEHYRSDPLFQMASEAIGVNFNEADDIVKMTNWIRNQMGFGDLAAMQNSGDGYGSSDYDSEIEDRAEYYESQIGNGEWTPQVAPGMEDRLAYWADKAAKTTAEIENPDLGSEFDARFDEIGGAPKVRTSKSIRDEHGTFGYDTLVESVKSWNKAQDESHLPKFDSMKYITSLKGYDTGQLVSGQLDAPKDTGIGDKFGFEWSNADQTQIENLPTRINLDAVMEQYTHNWIEAKASERPIGEGWQNSEKDWADSRYMKQDQKLKDSMLIAYKDLPIKTKNKVAQYIHDYNVDTGEKRWNPNTVSGDGGTLEDRMKDIFSQFDNHLYDPGQFKSDYPDGISGTPNVDYKGDSTYKYDKQPDYEQSPDPNPPTTGTEPELDPTNPGDGDDGDKKGNGIFNRMSYDTYRSSSANLQHAKGKPLSSLGTDPEKMRAARSLVIDRKLGRDKWDGTDQERNDILNWWDTTGGYDYKMSEKQFEAEQDRLQALADKDTSGKDWSTVLDKEQKWFNESGQSDILTTIAGNRHYSHHPDGTVKNYNDQQQPDAKYTDMADYDYLGKSRYKTRQETIAARNEFYAQFEDEEEE